MVVSLYMVFADPFPNKNRELRVYEPERRTNYHPLTNGTVC